MLCPDTNTPVLYPKSQRCAKRYYSDAVQTFSPSVKATVKLINQVSITADIGLKNEAITLKEKMTSEDQLMQGVLFTAFLSHQQRPCHGDATLAKALDDVANYKVKLETIRADYNNNKDLRPKSILDKYYDGKDDGTNVGIVMGALDRFYADNTRYPTDIIQLPGSLAKKALNVLGARLIYTYESDEAYKLQFAGQDYKLNTSDDKIEKGFKGKSK